MAEGMFWQVVTRLGEGAMLLPAVFAAAWLLVRQRDNWRVTGIWLASLGAAVLITLVSKIAFMGWGLGWAAINFSGFSGHAMVAAAVYPVLFAVLVPASSTAVRKFCTGTGMALALLVGLSRVVIGVHSWSEVIAGLLLGGMVTACVLGANGFALALATRRPQASQLRIWAAPLAIAVWLGVMPAMGAGFNSHSVITEWSLRLSGRSVPYTRGEMLRPLGRP